MSSEIPRYYLEVSVRTADGNQWDMGDSGVPNRIGDIYKERPDGLSTSPGVAQYVSNVLAFVESHGYTPLAVRETLHRLH